VFADKEFKYQADLKSMRETVTIPIFDGEMIEQQLVD